MKVASSEQGPCHILGPEPTIKINVYIIDAASKPHVTLSAAHATCCSSTWHFSLGSWLESYTQCLLVPTAFEELHCISSYQHGKVQSWDDDRCAQSR